MQRALDRRGFGPVAGVDEAGRGACAGPLVVAACALKQGGTRLDELTDSKQLTAQARERLYEAVIRRALAYSIVILGHEHVDAEGVHATNVAGMRMAIARLDPEPGYVLTDGFAVPGLAAPSLPVTSGDEAVACVAAASVLAKVRRDQIMSDLHARYPGYGFDTHKGYVTSRHRVALDEHGPCTVHRWSYANVAAAARAHGQRAPRPVSPSAAARMAPTTSPDESLCADDHSVGKNETARSISVPEGETVSDRQGGTSPE